MARNGFLEFRSSKCVDSQGRIISTCLVYEPFYVEVLVENISRKQPVTDRVRVALYKDVAFGLDEMVNAETQILTVPPLETKRVVASFIPVQESSYYYTINIGDEIVSTKLYSNRLNVFTKETSLLLEEPPHSVSRGEAIAFRGKLVATHTCETIPRAKIHIHHDDLGSDKVLATGITQSDGSFNIEWKAQKLDWMHHQGGIYARFEGDDLYKPSKSDRFIISVIPRRVTNLLGAEHKQTEHG